MQEECLFYLSLYQNQSFERIKRLDESILSKSNRDQELQEVELVFEGHISPVKKPLTAFNPAAGGWLRREILVDCFQHLTSGLSVKQFLLEFEEVNTLLAKNLIDYGLQSRILKKF